MTVTHSPDSLYKILSIANWESSQYKESLVLDSDDDLFIHFSTENQLSRILTKYWQDRDYVVLKIDPKKLLGQLVFEANPGGENKYYHLYNGYIPTQAVTEVKKHLLSK